MREEKKSNADGQKQLAKTFSNFSLLIKIAVYYTPIKTCQIISLTTICNRGVKIAANYKTYSIMILIELERV